MRKTHARCAAVPFRLVLVVSVNIFLTTISYGWCISYGDSVLTLAVFLIFAPESLYFL